jgi:CO/xanthine dehydrogenase Mo-binding subunit/aerobic-type carbon monoxide dehydrogenase small subunit (CoxS/CutS family)
MESQTITLIVNGKPAQVEPSQHGWTLVRYLREGLGLTGTKQSCDNEGTCGTCTVIVNGRAKRACLEKMANLQGARIETIESLAVEGHAIPHPLLQTVVQDGIFQCGYCAPGAIMIAKALLDKNPAPTDKEISSVLSSVICRCVGLNRMDRSVRRAGAILRREAASTWTAADTANEHLTLDKLTGCMKYSDDLSFPGMVYAQARRADIPHGRLKRLHTSRAEQAPGILAVLTAKDIPGDPIYGLITADQPALCDDEVRFVGDALAVVVGETPEQVEAALGLIDVELEPLPVISDPLQALRPDAPVLHPRLKAEYPDMPNVLKHHAVRKGDPAQGFAEADVIIEDDYETPFIEHAYMEIEACIAVPEADGTLTVYCGSQSPTDDQRQIAGVLGEPEEKIRVAHMYMGGGFGGKEDIGGQIHAALAARATGRPVKVRWTRAESLLTHQKRHATRMHYKMGARRDGTLTAAEISVYGDTGAYASAGEAVLFRSAAFACGPYNVPHVKVDTYAVHTNNPTCGAFRGFGSPQVAFAVEQHLEKLAEALGIDSYEMRMQNALDYGDATITGDVLNEVVSASLKACLKRVKEAMDATPRPELPPGEKLGIGYATAYKNVGLGSNIPDGAGARVSLEPDGTFLVRHGAADMGQGSNEVMGLIAARTLGVPLGLVRIHTGDTRLDPAGGMTTASRATFVSGNATLLASQGLRQKLWQAVADEFLADPEALEIVDGVFTDRHSGRAYISLKELAGDDARFEYQANYDAPPTQPIPAWSSAERPKTPPAAPLHFAYGYGAQAAMVAVNEATGAVRLIKLIAAHDVGLPINPRGVVGQIEGAAIQGLGYAISEAFPTQDGVPQATKFKDLGLLRFRDLPEIEAIVVEDPHPLGPYGAKGMGELAISPTAPAVAIAIHDAVGVWINQLPATRERVYRALQARQKD